jgi:hypothetical protein
MNKVVTAAFALSALFAASGKAHAEVNYPWCIIGNTRAVECYFSSREQCAQDGRNRGFGGQCIQNPFYKPGKPTVSDMKGTASQAARPSQVKRAGAKATPNSYDECAKKALDLGFVPGQAGRIEYICECTAGGRRAFCQQRHN